MKKLVILAAILILATAACQQRTEREVSATETTETTTYSTATVDTAAAAEATEAATDSAAKAAKDAAHATGTAMETAGKEIQEQTKTDTRQ